MNKIKNFFLKIKSRVIGFKHYNKIFLISVVYLYAYLFLSFINIYVEVKNELDVLKEKTKQCLEKKSEIKDE